MPVDSSTTLTVGKSRAVFAQAWNDHSGTVPGLTYAYSVLGGGVFTYDAATGNIRGVAPGSDTLRASVVGDPLAPTADLNVVVSAPTSPVHHLVWTVGPEV